MRNLELWDLAVRNLEISSKDKSVICLGHGLASSCSELYVCTNNLILNNFDKNGEIKWSKDLSEFVSLMNSPMNVTFLSLQNSLCVGLENGELLSIDDADNNCEVVGIFNSGLLAMEWSPDQELLAIVTKEFNTVLLSCTFDPINEVSLFDEAFGVKQFITVGWGKKETQFHGSEGKQAAKVKNEVIADSSTTLDEKVKITWRGDGSLYAIGVMIDGIRRFKVFDREGQLQYTSEKQQGIESNLAWRPSGNVIATTQKLTNKYMIAFFEKNGLKHGGFDLTLNDTTHVEDIVWSSDSEILTLQCKDTSTDTQKLLLYTTGNYHWYLKQTLLFKSDQKIIKLMWDNDFDIANNKKLHIILHTGKYYTYSWIWNINHSKGKSLNDDAVVTVIDGKKLLVTSFKQTVVPPPMASFEIELDSYINAVCFAPHNDNVIDTNKFFVCTADNNLIFYRQKQKSPLLYETFKTMCFDSLEYPFQYYNWYWINSNTIICVSLIENLYNLLEFSIVGDQILHNNVISLPSSILRVELHPKNTSKLFLELNEGEIVQYNIGKNTENTHIKFNVSCPKFNIIYIDDDILFIGLSHKGHLYIHDRIKMNNVSSFFVHSDFLLVTTLQHLLLCTELTTPGLESIIEYQKNESSNIYKRKIERGAKLVIVVPCDTRSVFQMPRGNLETIQPRPLSLKIIGKCLDALHYHEGFDLMRKQRINLNLIYDHDPENFVKNIDIFLDSIKNNSWLNLFLSDLENVDVTKTMYASSYIEKPKQPNDTNSKIQKICDLIREKLAKSPDKDNKVLPLITTHVKKNTVSDFEKALIIIKELKLKETNGNKMPVSSDEALKYLLYMVDVNNLFDVALGMYDFDLVLLVANKSQRDPKEYIPMLDELNMMDENYKKFSINKHLKRFDQAVNYLVQCGPNKYEELKTFVKYHSLYREALSLFTPDEDIFKEISEDFGLYLKLKKHYTEAGIVYENANNNEKAIECYKEAVEWELAIKLAYTWPTDEFKNLCRSLVDLLKGEKRHRDAITILERYVDDFEESIAYAIECGQYKSVLRMCSQYDRKNYINERLLPALLEEYKNIKYLIETNWSDFVKYRDRLFIVREDKRENPVDLYDSYANKDCDLYSDAGSTLASSSRGSSRSFRSSKNRRKHERKVASLKEGSRYEDVALVMALHTLVTSSYDLRLQVKEIVVTLSCLNKNKDAFILQTSLEKLLREMKDSFKDIWTNELIIESTNALIAAQNIPEGSSIIPQGIASLEPHIRIAPVVQDINWKLEGLN